MSDLSQKIATMSPKRLALVALELEAKLDALEAERREPIAIVGMACRFPGGANTPDAFWTLLRDGRSGIGTVPADRWDIESLYDADPDAAGKVASKWGGFLDDVRGFDPAFFGISPREAVMMDPQQRLLMEVGWEALEHAGIAPQSLYGSATGVFVGICGNDYLQMLSTRDFADIDAYLASGNAFSVAAGRFSYVLGLHGPAIAVDTSCSSSLVAVHMACQSLRGGESKMAVAAGVNVICYPQTSVTMSRSHMMAPDGQCKTFDASADGFVRGEGCGVVVLKRLADARRDGDRVLAVIRGSATNQDGRTSGLTAPNALSQEAVIKAAVSAAGVSPQDVTYVEAHGTGTSLGDPIEARALGAALGAGRGAGKPLYVGSVKTNIGHLEAGAGVAGLIKVVLALQHREIPPSLNFKNPSPHIPWAELPLEVPTTRTAWPADCPRIAGVSSFGFSGTNAHIIVEEAPAAAAPSPQAARPFHVLALSARNRDALDTLAREYVVTLESPGARLDDVCHTAAAGRSHFAARLAVSAATAAETAAQLRMFLDRADSRVASGHAPAGSAPEVAFLFTGQGAQYVGMGRELYETQPTFRQAIDRCADILRPIIGRDLLTILYPGPGETPSIDDTAWSQPALFAVEYALAQLWRSWGIQPAAVLGHSLGEYVAACVAGVFSLEDGLRIIAERGRLMHSLPRTGVMVAIHTSEQMVTERVRALGACASIAGVNGPGAVVLSGRTEDVRRVQASFEAEGVECRPLAISNGFHSPIVDPILDEFEAVVASATLRAPRVPFISNLTGATVGEEVATAGYWRRHLREPVRFSASIETLWKQGVRVFLEAGPHSTLLGMARRCVPDGEGVWVPSLRRGQQDWAQLLGSVALLYANGVDVDWKAFDAPYGPGRVTLPTYPFQRQPYWVDVQSRAAGRRMDHPLLGTRLRTPTPTFELRLDAGLHAFLRDHRLGGTPVAPAAFYLEVGLAAAREVLGRDVRVVESLTLSQPLRLEPAPIAVHCVINREGDGAATFEVLSLADGAADVWTRHASGRVNAAMPERRVHDAAAAGSRAMEALTPQAFYAFLGEQGMDAGESLRCATSIQRAEGEAFASLTFAADRESRRHAFILPPSRLDACTLLLAAASQHAPGSAMHVLAGIEAVETYGELPERVQVHARLEAAGADDSLIGTLEISGGDQGVLVEMRGIRLQRIRPASVDNAWVYGLEWQLLDPAASDAPVVGSASLVDVLESRCASLRAQHGLNQYDALAARLDEAVGSYVLDALSELGWHPAVGDRTTVAALRLALRVADRHARLFGRLMDLLVEDGILERAGDAFTVVRLPAAADPHETVQALVHERGDMAAHLALTTACAEALASVLPGETDPLSLLFPGGSLAAVERVYEESPFGLAYNALVADAVAAVCERGTAARPIRILEIGAGTGGTTRGVLARLDPASTRYTFTDLSPVFLARAEEKFAAYPFVEYRLFDIERDPAAQGFVRGAFDVVIAANVLHATANLRATLAHARQLMAPGAVLVLLEGTAASRWSDITFGLTEGWWRFQDADVRPSHPLVSAARWRALLEETGFVDVVAVPGDASTGESRRQSVIAATAAPNVADAGGARHIVCIGGSALADALAREGRERGSVTTCSSAEELPVVLAGLDAANVETDIVCVSAFATVDETPRIASEAIACIRETARARVPSGSRVWFVTAGAQAIPGETAPVSAAAAAAIGIAQTAAFEHPDWQIAALDVDPRDTPAAQARAILDELSRAGQEEQVAIRAARRYGLRLVRRPTPPERAVIRKGAAYLITGGLGAVGAETASWLADRGAGHIVLTARRALPPRERWDTAAPDDRARIDVVRRLEAKGVAVTVAAVDVGDMAAMRGLLDQFGRDGWPELAGIVHAATQVSARPLADMDAGTLTAMLKPKVDGAIVLDAITRERELDFVALFSSMAGLFGGPGIGHYAAANAFLDRFAWAKRAEGRPFLTVNWGVWEVQRLESASFQQLFHDAGLLPMAPVSALTVLESLIAAGVTQAGVAAVDWQRLAPVYDGGRPRRLLSGLRTAPTAAAVSGGPAVTEISLRDRLADAMPADRETIVREFVHQQVVRVLGLDAGTPISGQAGLFEMGMDSLMSVELKSRLQRGVGAALPSTLTFNYPTVDALSRFLAHDVLAIDAAAAAVPADGAAIDEDEDGLDDMSEDELAAMLAARLGDIR